MNMDLINDLQGKSKNLVDESYFYNDEEHLLEEYIKHIPALTIRKEVHHVTVKSKEFLELENKNRELQNQVDNIFEKLDHLESLSWDDIKKEY